MENTCIYRTRYKYHKCNKECVENSKFCKDHIKFKNIGFFDDNFHSLILYISR